MKTLKEWIDFYEKKANDTYNLPDGFDLWFDCDKGFAQFKQEGRLFLVFQCCGDGKYWRELAYQMAKEAGCSHLCTTLTRKPEPYVRTFGWIIIEKIEEKGKYPRYICQDKQGGKVIMTQQGYFDDTPFYYVTQEVK